MKLAITLGSMLAGKKLATDPKGLMKQGAELVESNPELSKLSDQIRSQLFQAARSAGIATANAQRALEPSHSGAHTRTTSSVSTQVTSDAIIPSWV